MLAKSVSFCVRKVDFSAHIKFYRTSAGKSTFRTKNDTEKAKFRSTAYKKILTLYLYQGQCRILFHFIDRNLGKKNVHLTFFVQMHLLVEELKTTTEFCINAYWKFEVGSKISLTFIEITANWCPLLTKSTFLPLYQTRKWFVHPLSQSKDLRMNQIKSILHNFIQVRKSRRRNKNY